MVYPLLTHIMRRGCDVLHDFSAAAVHAARGEVDDTVQLITPLRNVFLFPRPHSFSFKLPLLLQHRSQLVEKSCGDMNKGLAVSPLLLGGYSTRRIR